MNIENLIKHCLVCMDLKGRTAQEVFVEIANLFSSSNLITDPETLIRKLTDREAMASTAIGDDFAIPHANSPLLDDMIMLIGKSSKGIVFDPNESKKVHLVFAVVFPEGRETLHLKVLARFARILKNADTLNTLLTTNDPDVMRHIFQSQNQEVI